MNVVDVKGDVMAAVVSVAWQLVFLVGWLTLKELGIAAMSTTQHAHCLDCGARMDIEVLPHPVPFFYA